MHTIVGGICKNIAPHIAVIDTFLQILIRNIPDIAIFIYENNSTDSTKHDLEVLRTKYSSNLRIQCEDVTVETLRESGKARTWDNLPCRMECIARARNALLTMIQREITVEDNDIVAFVDIDLPRLPAMGVLLQYLKELPDGVDAIFANGLNRYGAYYDMYALRDKEQPFGPEVIGEEFWQKMRQGRRITGRQPVHSAFGGIGIYRGTCIKENSYSATPTKELDILLKQLFSISGISIPTYSTHINGALQGIYLYGAIKGNDIFYQNNSGYNYPVVCEHSTFHATMIVRGQDRLFIEPSLLYYSTH